MTDIKSEKLSDDVRKPVTASGSAPSQQPLWPLIELMFFAYRDFTSAPDEVLAQFGFGRAHHRVLHFVNRNPGLTVADLLDILKITKQSLARVLKQLVKERYVEQRAGATDRRQRRLYPTSRGKELAERLASQQSERIMAALESAGPDAQRTFHAILHAMVNREEQDKVSAIIEGGGKERAQ